VQDELSKARYTPSLKRGVKRATGGHGHKGMSSSLQLRWPGPSGLLKRRPSSFSGFDHSIWHLSCSYSYSSRLATRTARNTRGKGSRSSMSRSAPAGALVAAGGHPVGALPFCAPSAPQWADTVRSTDILLTTDREVLKWPSRLPHVKQVGNRLELELRPPYSTSESLLVALLVHTPLRHDVDWTGPQPPPCPPGPLDRSPPPPSLPPLLSPQPRSVSVTA
jgi:hypothetical protein